MRSVSDSMLAPPVTVEPGATIQVASVAMIDADAHAAVVVDGGTVCGVITAEIVADALAHGHDPSETPVGEIAERDPPFVRADEPLAEVHQRMRAGHHAVLAVAGSHGEPLGVLVDPEA